MGDLEIIWHLIKELFTEDERNGSKWRGTREQALKRDGYKCINCNSPHKLEGHHILNWTDHPFVRFVLSNVATLCRRCHTHYHVKFMGGFKIKTTRKSFIKWLKTNKIKPYKKKRFWFF